MSGSAAGDGAQGGPSGSGAAPGPTLPAGPFRRKEPTTGAGTTSGASNAADLNYFRPGALTEPARNAGGPSTGPAPPPPAQERFQTFQPRNDAPAATFGTSKKRYRPEYDENLFKLPPQPAFSGPGTSAGAPGPSVGRSRNDAAGRPINANGGNVGPQHGQEPGLQLPKAPSTNTILVSTTQKGNPVLDHIRNVPWEFNTGLAPDYQVGRTSCALFLSLKYHRLHPEYVSARVQKLGRMYALRILLVLVDVDDHEKHLREIHAVCVANAVTVILAWSNEEAGRYLETFKAYENKPPDAIKAKVEDGYLARLTNFLTSVKGVNKTDVVNLASGVGVSGTDLAISKDCPDELLSPQPLKNIIQASQAELIAIPGFGETKANKLYAALRTPFRIDHAARDRERARKAVAEDVGAALISKVSSQRTSQSKNRAEIRDGAPDAAMVDGAGANGANADDAAADKEQLDAEIDLPAGGLDRDMSDDEVEDFSDED